jgi:fused signal recognition particle receptor
VVRRDLPDAPHEVLLVLDANTGQNGVRQAREFLRAVEVTGIVLTKLDGTARGGVVLGISQETGIPVRYVGLGEKIEDLIDFDPEAFVRALFEA